MKYFFAGHFTVLATNFHFVCQNFCVGALETVRGLNVKRRRNSKIHANKAMTRDTALRKCMLIRN